MTNASNAQAEFDGWIAFHRAIRFLSIHLWIAAMVATAFFVVLVVTSPADQLPRRVRDYPRFVLSELFFMLAFEVFGTVTAFFLSLGLKRGETGESVNGLIETFAAPFISLLTAGIVFVTSRDPVTVDRPRRVAVAVTCFLVATIVSYRTFFYQILTAF